LRSKAALIGFIVALAAFSTAAASAADKDQKYTMEKFKSDVKAAGKGIKDAAVEVGHQISSGTRKAYHSVRARFKKDVTHGKPGDGSIAKQNDAASTATKGRK